MEKLARSQVAKGIFLLILLLFAPFIPSSSLRTSYLYFLLNILIVALGAEAGFLKAISRPNDEAKKQHLMTNSRAVATPVARDQASVADNVIAAAAVTDSTAKPGDPALQKAAPLRAQTTSALKGCSSKPSLFFIGGWEGESASAIKEEEEEEDEEKEADHQRAELSKQELFAKAEAFIGNFYMQLKMQREESWKKIHELYQRAF